MVDKHPTDAVRGSVGGHPAGFLVVLEGAKAGQVVRLDRPTFVIGRADEADLQVPDRAVSSVHAIIRVDPDGTASIQDLRSTNGTRVNDQRITAAQMLSDGDRIAIGACTTLQFTRKPQMVELSR